jgi:hypothetical protein
MDKVIPAYKLEAYLESLRYGGDARKTCYKQDDGTNQWNYKASKGSGYHKKTKTESDTKTDTIIKTIGPSFSHHVNQE